MKKQTVMHNLFCNLKGAKTVNFVPDIFMMILT